MKAPGEFGKKVLCSQINLGALIDQAPRLGQLSMMLEALVHTSAFLY